MNKPNKRIMLLIVIIIIVAVILIGGGVAYYYYATKNKSQLILSTENQKDLEKKFMTAIFNNSSQFVDYKNIANEGNISTLKDSSYLIWKPTDKEMSQQDGLSDFVKSGYYMGTEWISIPEGHLISTPLSSYKTNENGKSRIYFLVETMLNYCHACGPFLGGAVFEKSGNYWKPVYINKYIGVYGNWGNLGKPNLFSIGDNKKAFEFQMSDMGQGIRWEGIAIYYFVNNEFHEILQIDTGGDNSGATESSEEIYDWSSTITTKPNPNSDFYDIVVKKTGTDMNSDNSKIVQVDGIDIYRWNNSKNEYEKITK